jgi:hypothetical protein
MDEVERLLQAFSAHGMTSAASKLDVLMDLERLDDPRIVAFFHQTLCDESQPTEVRVHILKQLRNRRLACSDRVRVAHVLGDIVSRRSSPDLRLQAALALGEFIDVRGVLDSLATVALAADEPIDLRYSAFTSLEQAAPTSDCVALLRQLSSDETLGPSARSVLLRWHIDSNA